MKAHLATFFALMLIQSSCASAGGIGVNHAPAHHAAKVKARADNVRDTARQIVGDPQQFQCLDQIVQQESGWDYTAVNAASGAYGLFQALPPSRMDSAGKDWETNFRTQIKWGVDYMKTRYGSPCVALAFRRGHGWY
ncbi:uncharacterized protein BDV17DRAFT_285875 [Aspergillus undulatus]|uniref:uncharacterized protein n=1 Tax=Aspergillus undulatus TaxID=1810928 RepID=UPI003CCDABDE